MSNLIFTLGSFSFITDFGSEPQSLSFNPGWRTNPVVVPQKRGVRLVSTPLSTGFPVNISGTISDTTHDALRTKTDTLLQIIGAGRQNLNVYSDRFMKVTASSFDIDFRPGSSLRILDFSLDLTGDEGLWQSETLDTTSATTDDTSVSITNNGTAPTPLKFTVTAPAGGLTAFTMKNATSDKTLSWTGSLTSGQTLIIDTDDKTITENGLVTIDGFSGRFWSLDVGANTIEVTSTDTSASVSIEKRDRFY